MYLGLFWGPLFLATLTRATVNVKDTRAVLGADIGFCIWTLLPALLESCLGSMSSGLSRSVDRGTDGDCP